MEGGQAAGDSLHDPVDRLGSAGREGLGDEVESSLLDQLHGLVGVAHVVGGDDDDPGGVMPRVPLDLLKKIIAVLQTLDAFRLKRQFAIEQKR